MHRRLDGCIWVSGIYCFFTTQMSLVWWWGVFSRLCLLWLKFAPYKSATIAFPLVGGCVVMLYVRVSCQMLIWLSYSRSLIFFHRDFRRQLFLCVWRWAFLMITIHQGRRIQQIRGVPYSLHHLQRNRSKKLCTGWCSRGTRNGRMTVKNLLAASWSCAITSIWLVPVVVVLEGAQRYITTIILMTPYTIQVNCFDAWPSLDGCSRHSNPTPQWSDEATEVFSDIKRWEDGKFKAKKLEEVIKSVVETITRDSESSLLEGDQVVEHEYII